MIKKNITINIDIEALKLIDEAAEKERRSRSNFLEVVGTQKAKQILGVD